jgi:preprotein translocase subunit Sss1
MTHIAQITVVVLLLIIGYLIYVINKLNRERD